MARLDVHFCAFHLCIVTAVVRCPFQVSPAPETLLFTPPGQQWTGMQLAGGEEDVSAEVQVAFALMTHGKVNHHSPSSLSLLHPLHPYVPNRSINHTPLYATEVYVPENVLPPLRPTPLNTKTPRA
jgi:hypothetical protein